MRSHLEGVRVFPASALDLGDNLLRERGAICRLERARVRDVPPNLFPRLLVHHVAWVVVRHFQVSVVRPLELCPGPGMVGAARRCMRWREFPEKRQQKTLMYKILHEIYNFETITKFMTKFFKKNI